MVEEDKKISVLLNLTGHLKVLYEGKKNENVIIIKTN